MSKFVVQFLTRPGCHLCDDARPVVGAAVLDAGGGVNEVDINSDDSLLARYGLRIPVILAPDGAVIAEGVINKRVVRRAMRKLG